MIRKLNPAAAPILFIALTGKDIPLTTLDDYAETYIAQRLSMISGSRKWGCMAARNMRCVFI